LLVECGCFVAVVRYRGDIEIEVGLSLGAVDGWSEKEKCEMMEAVYKGNKAIFAMVKAQTWPRLTERASRIGMIRLTCLPAEKCSAWMAGTRTNVTFLSIGIGTATWLLLTAFLNNLFFTTSIHWSQVNVFECNSCSSQMRISNTVFFSLCAPLNDSCLEVPL